jgi:hypothetical protein
VTTTSDAPARVLLAALAQRYDDRPFSARDAAAGIPSPLWRAAGVPRPTADACGRWLRAHRSATLTAKADRNGVNQWRLKVPAPPAPAAAAPAAAPQAALPVAGVPEPPQPPQPPQAADSAAAPAAPPPQPWWALPASALDTARQPPRGAWWAPGEEGLP